ncbi:ABC transporter permease [Thermasporomyces composti]|jgi:ABC-2 type transport system permease protein|uniref:ABC-2 type transport system permease protein n=1 Tax=Thermasporomyces composti TaxID=696763 RepID=A0A3D9VC72_THECX|nr:ABC transporter permease subunit [Thermasporomyces composti]REF37780.1 ABC-2 type transport system permease protein [Thermasporomyces composti]
MNATIARLTVSTLLGKRRALFLVILPALLLGFAVLVRWLAGPDPHLSAGLLQTFALGTIVPLLGLITGTGVIGSEIDDGSIVYILSKPVRRSVIVVTKLLVSIACLVVFAAIPIVAAGLVMVGLDEGMAVGFGVGAVVAGIAYSALFLLLAVVTKHAVVFGLIYALIWESMVGGFIPGAQMLSIQQWALALTEAMVSSDTAQAAVGTGAGTILLIVVTVLATVLAGQRLRSLTLTESE